MNQILREQIDVELCHDPVFIVGSPRSGTSVLAWALGQHEDLWTTPQETDFLSYLIAGGALDRLWQESNARPGGWLQTNGVDRLAFMAAMGFAFTGLITSRARGRRWVEQSASYTTMLGQLADLFPGARFVHILRDGRSVVESMMHCGFQTAWATDFAEACRTWAWFVDTAVGFAQREPDRCLTVTYDFMSESPRECFAGILDFLEAEPSDAPAEFVQTRRINSAFQPDGPMSQPSSGPADLWEQWTPEQRATFRDIAGRVFIEHRLGTERDLEG